MPKKEAILLFVLIADLCGLAIWSFYEQSHPLVLHGKKAKLVAIPATGADINSPVSHLFGRAPYFIICNRASESYEVVPNKYLDAQHAAGLRASRMVLDMGVDAVCADNIGFEPSRIFLADNVEIYTGIKGTVWETLQMFPDGLKRVNKQTVPPHFGITGSKTPIPCTSFDTTANIKEIVQGRFLICPDCGYRVSRTSAGHNHALHLCPRCKQKMREVIAVADPIGIGKGGMKPKVKVF